MCQNLFLGLALTFCTPHLLAAAAPTVSDARTLWLAGKYDEAIEKLAPSAASDPKAAILTARCLAASGRRDAAEKALAGLPSHADVRAERAMLALQRGDHDAAKRLADEALRLAPEHLQARYIRAELARCAGKLDEAGRAYKWFVDYYNGRQPREAESLWWIGLAAAQHARWNRLHEQFQFLVQDLYPDILKAEPGYWPAHLAAGRLFLEKYNDADANRELLAAVETNPRAAEVHVALAELAVRERKFQEAQASVDRALEINRECLAAWLAKADLVWSNFQTQATLKLLQEKALAIDPRDERALGRVAACYWLLDRDRADAPDARFRKLCAEVDARNPHAGEFYFALAEWLAVRHQAAAERFYRRTLECMPRHTGTQTALAMLVMLRGEEDQARSLFRLAYKEDPFNVRVNNMLQVLDVLKGMKILETPHVRICYDAGRDELLAQAMSQAADRFYPELCRRLGFRPPGKPLVEVFGPAAGLSGRQWFSARMTGLPYIGAVAASTGYIVAMVSPQEPGLRTKFNWDRVLRHELTHVVTLQQTDFRMPHWYTEGLAMASEETPVPTRWCEMLIRRVPGGRLLALADINHGFTRAQSSDDWLMAYCQSRLLVEYMESRWGAAIHARLIDAYRRGLETDEAVPNVFGVDARAFERDYVAYLGKYVSGLKRLDTPPRPDLSDVQALRKAGKLDEAIQRLERKLDRQRPHGDVLVALAELQIQTGRFDAAAELYALAERLEPWNIRWTKSLARVYLLSKKDGLDAVLERWAAGDVDDVVARKKLAALALSRSDFAAAARWTQQALEIDVADPEIHEALADALSGSHHEADAVRERAIAARLRSRANPQAKPK